MITKQLSVFLENKKGRICAAADILAQSHVNIRALSLADTSEFGILRLIVDKPDEGKQALNDAGIVVRVTNVLALTMDDTPGGTLGVLHLLAESGISVEYMYAYVGKTTGKAFMIIQAEELEAAEEILRRNGFMQADVSEI